MGDCAGTPGHGMVSRTISQLERGRRTPGSHSATRALLDDANVLVDDDDNILFCEIVIVFVL